MKGNMIILLVILAGIIKAHSQNTHLPQGKSTICLFDSKIIKDVKLWNVTGNLLEYEKEGSLHDVAINKIEIIKGPEGNFIISNVDSLLITFYFNEQSIPKTENDKQNESLSNSNKESVKVNTKSTHHNRTWPIYVLGGCLHFMIIVATIL